MSNRWSPQAAWQWTERHGWPVGCNFTPSTACNQLEFWQADNFDAPTLKRELELARSLGFNLLRVYLHDLAWKTDASGLLSRMNQFLTMADARGIKILFVFFDDCWNNYAFPGAQPEPRPGIHNSQWLQSPGARHVINPDTWPQFKDYVQGVMQHFKDDTRIYGWDLYNEPGNEGMLGNSLGLLEAVYEWARDVNPAQPLTTGPFRWTDAFKAINDCHLANADIISFHNYESLDVTRAIVDQLKNLDRPLLCTEYMARPADCWFETHLPYFKTENIGAINWGFVAGKTQTQFPWEAQPGREEPPLWFHDIFRQNGSPYRQEEVDLIRNLTGANRTAG
jgi:hypothetical protein